MAKNSEMKRRIATTTKSSVAPPAAPVPVALPLPDALLRRLPLSCGLFAGHVTIQLFVVLAVPYLTEEHAFRHLPGARDSPARIAP